MKASSDMKENIQSSLTLNMTIFLFLLVRTAFSINLCLYQNCSQYRLAFDCVIFNPPDPNISVHILHTVFDTFP